MDEKTININELIKTRRSPRAYAETDVEVWKLNALFEAAKWAPSAMNEQPWRFIYAAKNGNPDSYEKIFSSLMEGNQTWAKSAPVLIVLCAKMNFSGQQNQLNKYAFYDAGLAMANALFEATELGLWVHQIGGFYPDIIKKELNIPEGFEPVVVATVGYLGDPNTLPENLKEREIAPRKRKEISEIVFNGKWEN
jgi:nitroreductase